MLSEISKRVLLGAFARRESPGNCSLGDNGVPAAWLKWPLVIDSAVDNRGYWKH